MGRELGDFMKILIATFEDQAPAEKVRDRIQGAGVAARAGSDYWIQIFVYWVRPAATQKVYVKTADFDYTRELLAKWDQDEHLLEAAIHCPECRSVRIEYPQYTRKFLTPLIIEWLISLGAGETNFYCMDCHSTWPRSVKPEPEFDVLGFPKPLAKKSQTKKR